jgi:plastocyanin
MRKFLTFTLLTGSLGMSGWSMPTPVAAQEAPATPSATLAAPAAADAAAKPEKVKYVAQTKKWGTLRVKFVVDGKVAELQKINAAADPICAAFPIMTENLIIGKDGAIKNVALFMDKKSKTKDVHPDLAKPAAAPVVLDNKNCVFVPHVLFVRPGQTITVTNSDATGHNANFNFFNNQAVNFLVPAGGKKDLKIETDEPAPIPVECNVHPWMKAHLIVQEHPYVGISGEDGVLEIANLPVGDVTLRVWHETGTIDGAMVAGKQEKWSRGRMEIAIKEGVNDLGTVKISPDAFKKK